MNTRRNFFHSLTLMAGAASVSPQIFIPRFEPVKWKSIAEPWIPADFYGEWKFVTGIWPDPHITCGIRTVPDFLCHEVSQLIEYRSVNGRVLLKEKPQVKASYSSGFRICDHAIEL
jgi:hypothetical protein